MHLKNPSSHEQPGFGRRTLHAEKERSSAQEHNIPIRFRAADNFSRPVKIRVTAIPAPLAARSLHIFAAGFTLNKPQLILRLQSRITNALRQAFRLLGRVRRIGLGRSKGHNSRRGSYSS